MTSRCQTFASKLIGIATIQLGYKKTSNKSSKDQQNKLQRADCEAATSSPTNRQPLSSWNYPRDWRPRRNHLPRLQLLRENAFFLAVALDRIA
jgi:hypothetical protein